MQISRRWRSVIVLAALYAIFLTTMILSDLWKWHDSTSLLLHTSLLTNFFLVCGLLFWFGEQWKYFRATIWVVFLVCCVVTTIHHWQKGNSWGYIFYPIWFVWGLFSLKEEIVKRMATASSQEASIELLSGSQK